MRASHGVRWTRVPVSSSRKLAYFVAVTTSLLLAALLALHAASALSVLIRSNVLCPYWSTAMREKRLTNVSRLLRITRESREIMYFHRADMLFHIVLKGGTNAILEWVYRGMTREREWSMERCETYIQNLSSPCWKGHASFVYTLPPEKQWQIYTSPDTLRVAFQRDPYERLISSFKSKYTCEVKRFHSDVVDRAFIPALRENANAGKDVSCMNVSEFADLLDRCRLNEGRPGYVQSVYYMETHIRPQNLYLDEIDYDMVLDVQNFSNPELMKPIFDKLPHQDNIENFVPIRHSSGGEKLFIPKEADVKLRAFAALSIPKMGTVKNCDK